MDPVTIADVVTVLTVFGPAIGVLTLLVVTFAIVDFAVRIFGRA